MKKLSLLLLTGLLTTSVMAQEAKTGWNFGALPAVTYSTDQGFQYGALVNLFDYGDGSIYPDYFHKIYIEASTFTKGSSILRVMYDSDYLIKGIRYAVDLSYMPDFAYDFYGFNGFGSVYNMAWVDDELDANGQLDPDYRSRLFYAMQRHLFRFKNDFIGNIGDNNWHWNAGLSIQNFKVKDLDVSKFNKGKDSEDPKYLDPDEPTLYEYYKNSGLLSPDEADGGWITGIKGGISYDSRDQRACPMSGIWAETGIEVVPEFLGAESSFGKLYLTWRQYFTLKEDDLSFAYRLGYQQTLFGDVPFYYQGQVIVSELRGALSEGLGGSKTIRGLLRNRVIGDGFAYGNAELRWKMVRFNFINQNFYIGTNYFFDACVVTDPIEVSEADLAAYLVTNGSPGETVNDFLSGDKDGLHMAAGLGLKIAMNENFIISADIGKALKEQDGDMEFYIGLNYLF
ncbi:MAG: BamA/TamA family outer membrane protein [Bacteroidales bacterium]|nr:BamA/TamA family outer membrane protein [Bacteroidales bacterium]